MANSSSMSSKSPFSNSRYKLRAALKTKTRRPRASGRWEPSGSKRSAEMMPGRLKGRSQIKTLSASCATKRHLTIFEQNSAYSEVCGAQPIGLRRTRRTAPLTFGVRLLNLTVDPLAVTFPDPDHSHEEYREITIGLTTKHRVVFVSHCPQGDRTRIIGARRATRKERKQYEEGTYE